MKPIHDIECKPVEGSRPEPHDEWLGRSIEWWQNAPPAPLRDNYLNTLFHQESQDQFIRNRVFPAAERQPNLLTAFIERQRREEMAEQERRTLQNLIDVCSDRLEDRIMATPGPERLNQIFATAYTSGDLQIRMTVELRPRYEYNTQHGNTAANPTGE